MPGRTEATSASRRGWRIAGARLIVAMTALGFPPLPALAASVSELAAYAGADRTQMLIEGARKERALTLYTSLTTEDANNLGAAFEKKYGVKLRVWRASNEDILQRAIVENRASRNDADLFETDAAGLEGLRRENLLQPVVSPVFTDLMPQAVKPESWIGTRLNIITAAYNTSAISAAEIPKTYDELRDPRWKGKLGVEAGDIDWFATVVTTMGEEAGLKLFRSIVAKNGASVRKGHTLMANLVASGEVPLAMTTYLSRVNQMKSAGAPIEAFQLAPTVARVNGIGLSPHSPHPCAALLFFDFMLTDAQQILAGREFFPTNLKAGKDTGALNLSFVDPALLIDEGEKWEKLFNEIVIRQTR